MDMERRQNIELGNEFCDSVRMFHTDMPDSTDRGASIIERSLTLTLGSDPEVAAAKMLANYNTLDYRPSLIERLSARPSPLLCPILVVHGTEDKAVRRFLNVTMKTKQLTLRLRSTHLNDHTTSGR